MGESTPSQFIYQNLGEAEYAVALFTYMRVLGYPAERISLLTTYNGQASLLRDIVQRRCAQNPFIGVPGRISTVDKYQRLRDSLAGQDQTRGPSEVGWN